MQTRLFVSDAYKVWSSCAFRSDEKARLRYVSLCSHADKGKYLLSSEHDNDLHT